MLRAKQVGGKEREDRQHHRNGYVAGQIGSTGENHDKTKQVEIQYQEENRQKIRRELHRTVAKSGTDHPLVYELNQSHPRYGEEPYGH